MNKKSTLLAAALMAVSSLTVYADDASVNPADPASPNTSVTSTDWKAGNYYYLRAGDGKYLSLYKDKQDSVVIVTTLGTTKTDADLALWEITLANSAPAGNTYQFKNKKTKAVLSFDKNVNAQPVLAAGVAEWSFSETGEGTIQSQLSADKTMQFYLKDTTVNGKVNYKLVFTKSANATGVNSAEFRVLAPGKSMPLEATDLGDGFSTFRLSFGDKIEGDIFSGKDLIATKDGDYLMLQEKGKEAEGYLGIDTLQTTGAGYNFSLDSIRTTVKPNKDCKLFKFTADLKNDSLTMFVKQDPAKNTDVNVVYVQLGDKKVLTVTNDDTKGIAPFITTSRGVPAEIATGTGVYFLKSASKGKDGGKYYYGDVLKAEKPSVNQLPGQWYIKEEGGLYSIVARTGSVSKLSKGEVFAVQGMENTFTFAGSTDSITVETQKVNLNDKYLGSRHFTKDEIANNGYVLNLIPAGAETSNSYTFTSDSLLKVTAGEAKDAVIFKLDSVESEEIGGAKSLGDVVSVVTYKLKSQFSNKYVAYDDVKKCLKISTESNEALVFRFNTNVDGGKYDMEIVSEGSQQGKFVSADSYSSNMVLLETPAYFNFVEMDAPEYGTFESSHRRFTSELKSLTMNPLNLFAEAKQEGQEITKANYEKDNFSLWLMKSDASTADRPLYFITTALAVDGVPGVDQIRYYMVSGNDSTYVGPDDKHRVLFTPNDTLETMKDNTLNPALWALKVTESGNYLLENQKDVTVDKSNRYIGIINSFVVMSNSGAEFTVESTPGPVANEEIEAASGVQVIGGVGEFSIRNASGKRITVSNILGQAVTSRYATSDYETIPTVRGVVIVSVEGDKAYKVIVK